MKKFVDNQNHKVLDIGHKCFFLLIAYNSCLTVSKLRIWVASRD